MKKLKTIRILTLLSALSLVACDPFKQYVELSPAISVSETKVSIDHEGAEPATITIKSNRSWNLIVPEEVDWLEADRTEYLNLEKIETEIPVTFTAEANPDQAERTAIVTLTSECGDISITILQRKPSPYMRFPDAVDGIIYIGEGLDSAIVSIVTNSEWTATLEDVDGFDSPALAASSGTSADTQISLSLAQYSVCFGRDASMKLKATLEDGSSAMLVIRQKPVLRAKFGTFTADKFISATADEWPLSSPTLDQMPTGKDTSSPFYAAEGDLVLKNGYIIKINSNAGIWVGSGTGLNGFGTHPSGDKTICSYLLLPAIEGVRLTKVVYHAAASSTKKLSLSIRDSARNTVVAGGELKEIGTEAMARPLLEWTLTGTEPNTVYSIHQANTGNMYLGDLILYYE